MPNRRRFIMTGLCALITSNICFATSAAEPAPVSPAHNDSGQRGSEGATILVIGDSLSAEYGIPKGSGWVTHIERKLRDHDTGYQIHNSSISGDTTSGGVSRLPTELNRHEPDIVIIELGSNDALRGLPLEMTRKNLAQMIKWCQDIGASVVLAGMQIPPNYGKRYADEFANIFPELATDHQVTLVPFLLDGIATKPDMFLEDAIHPNEAGQRIMAKTMWSHLAPLVIP